MTGVDDYEPDDDWPPSERDDDIESGKAEDRAYADPREISHPFDDEPAGWQPWSRSDRMSW